MDISIQGILLNVRDLERSIEFYRSVLDAEPVSHQDQVSALMVNHVGRQQVLLLRQAARSARHGGGASIGARLLCFEVAHPDLTEVERRLTEQGSFQFRKRSDSWEAVFGIDPDRNSLSFSAGIHGTPLGGDDWGVLDDLIYSVGE